MLAKRGGTTVSVLLQKPCGFMYCILFIPGSTPNWIP